MRPLFTCCLTTRLKPAAVTFLIALSSFLPPRPHPRFLSLWSTPCCVSSPFPKQISFSLMALPSGPAHRHAQVQKHVHKCVISICARKCLNTLDVSDSGLSKCHLYSSSLQSSKTFLDIPTGIQLVIKTTRENFSTHNHLCHIILWIRGPSACLCLKDVHMLTMIGSVKQ